MDEIRLQIERTDVKFIKIYGGKKAAVVKGDRERWKTYKKTVGEYIVIINWCEQGKN